MDSKKLKGKFYGENTLIIDSGSVVNQKYSLFGENNVKTQHVSSEAINVSYFGASKLALKADNKIFVMGIGELDLEYPGNIRFKRRAIGTAIINGEANRRAIKKITAAPTIFLILTSFTRMEAFASS